LGPSPECLPGGGLRLADAALPLARGEAAEEGREADDPREREESTRLDTEQGR
jgi:hypothetical protein